MVTNADNIKLNSSKAANKLAIQEDKFEKINKISLDILKFMETQKQELKMKFSLESSINEDIFKARSKIFISGTGMSYIHAKRKEFSRIPSQVELIFAVSNYDNTDIKNYLRYFFGQTDGHFITRKNIFIDAIDTIKKHREVNIIPVDVFIPTAYVAVDYDKETEFSFIQAKHYILNDNDDKNDETSKSFNLTVYPGVDLYEIYRKQIEYIIKRNGVLSRDLKK